MRRWAAIAALATVAFLATRANAQFTTPPLSPPAEHAREGPFSKLRKLFTGWFTPPEPCPSCGLSFNRDNDATVGWIIVNLGVTEIVFVALGVAVLLATWPDVPWTGLTVVAVAVNGLLPLLLVPFSRTVWAAIELLMDRMDGPPAAP